MIQTLVNFPVWVGYKRVDLLRKTGCVEEDNLSNVPTRRLGGRSSLQDHSGSLRVSVRVGAVLLYHTACLQAVFMCCVCESVQVNTGTDAMRGTSNFLRNVQASRKPRQESTEHLVGVLPLIQVQNNIRNFHNLLGIVSVQNDTCWTKVRKMIRILVYTQALEKRE